MPYLVSRLGSYCSYCERRIQFQLAVEHIQPKSLPKYRALETRWENFLLACVNCNSTKKDKDVLLDQALLPDRDHTDCAYDYLKDGTVRPAAHLDPLTTAAAQATLALTGLDKRMSQVHDENGRLVAIDRMTQRMEAWLTAEAAKEDVDNAPGVVQVRTSAVRTAVHSGFFCIWMRVFANDADMRNRLIDAFPGTRDSGCYDATASWTRPAPNPDALPHGAKV